MNKSITVLGSTGSVGTQALDVAQRDGYHVRALAAGSDYITIEKQARLFHPQFCVLDSVDAASKLKLALFDTDIKVLSGLDGIKEIIDSSENDVIVNAIIGAAGLIPTMASIKKGGRLALANKESLVMAGSLIMSDAKKYKTELIPVDSEHSAIFQCLEGRKGNEINRILLTASGGPFYGYTPEALEKITVEQALAHPTWKMGKRITIDSATLMNKGFEVIEASHLFGVGAERIKVVIQRESIIHSMVEYSDNSIIAQMSVPDMRLCVQYAVNYPLRERSVIDRLDLASIGHLTFGEPDISTFPLLGYAFDCLAQGGAMPAVLNAANETAVSAFLEKRIGFTDIAKTVFKTLQHLTGRTSGGSIEEILEYDSVARSIATEIIG